MPLRKERYSLTGGSTYKIKKREESQNKIDVDFREREQAFKEKKHMDLCDLKERGLTLREKELEFKMNLPKGARTKGSRLV